MREMVLQFSRLFTNSYDGVFEIRLPAYFDEAPISQTRKMLKLYVRDREMFEAIPDFTELDQYIDEYVTEGKTEWIEEQHNFAREYRSPEFDSHGNKRSDKKEIAKVKRYDDALLRNVNAKKRSYERRKKIKSTYYELRGIKYVSE